MTTNLPFGTSVETEEERTEERLLVNVPGPGSKKQIWSPTFDHPVSKDGCREIHAYIHI